MTCNECGEKPKKACGAFPKAVIEIDNPGCITLFRKVAIPASMGDDTTLPPAIGKYRNVLLVYEANNHAYLYSSDGIPTLLTSDVVRDLENKIDAVSNDLQKEVSDREDADTELDNRLSVVEGIASTALQPSSIDKVVMTDINLGANTSTSIVEIDGTKENLLTGETSTKNIPLPVASHTQAGVMNSSTFDAVTDNSNNIRAIMNGAVAISGLPASPSQTDITDAWKAETGLDELINRASAYDVSNNKVWTYYSNDDTWHAASNTTQVTINTFTNSSEGTIKGSTNIGQVFAENDGTGSVNGWDALSANVSTNTGNISSLQTAVAGKQNILTAGDNINISGNTISAVDTRYTAGNAVTIDEDGTTSAWIYPERFFLDDEYTEGEGTAFEMKDTAYLQVRRIEMRGDTNQNSYQGVNLLKVPYTGTIEGTGAWNWYIAPENSISFYNNGATTVNTKIYLYKRDVDSYDMPQVPSGQYQLARFNSGEEYADKIEVETSNGTFTATRATNWRVTFPNNVTINSVSIVPTSNWATSAAFRLQPELTPVAQASSEEPFTGRLPAPSPDYPQPVGVVTGTQGFAISASNLYNVSDVVRPWPTPSQSFVDKDDFIHLEYDNTNGTATAYPRLWTNNLGLNTSTEYTIVAEIKSASVSGGGERSSAVFVSSYSSADRNAQFRGNWDVPIKDLATSIGQTLMTTEITKDIFVAPGTGLDTFLSVRAGEKASVVFRLSVIKDTSITPDKFVYRKYAGQSGTVNLGKNLFNKDDSHVLNGYYFSGANSTISNTAPLASRSAIIYVPCYPYVGYSISGYSSLGFDSVSVATTKELPNTNIKTGRVASSGLTHIENYTTPEDSNFLVIGFTVPEGQTMASKIPQLLESLQIERGLNVTEYSPYFKPIELLKLGSNQDYIYRSGTSYFLVKTTDSLVLDGTEVGWQYDASTNTVKLPTPVGWTGSDYLCTHFKKGNPSTTNNTFSIDSSYITFRADGVTDNLSTWTNWLTQRGVTVCSQIQTPIETEIVNPLVGSGLANMYNCHTYPDLSSISSSSNGDLSSYLYVEAFKNSLEGITGAIRNIPICC